MHFRLLNHYTIPHSRQNERKSFTNILIKAQQNKCLSNLFFSAVFYTSAQVHRLCSFMWIHLSAVEVNLMTTSEHQWLSRALRVNSISVTMSKSKLIDSCLFSGDVRKMFVITIMRVEPLKGEVVYN